MREAPAGTREPTRGVASTPSAAAGPDVDTEATGAPGRPPHVPRATRSRGRVPDSIRRAGVRRSRAALRWLATPDGKAESVLVLLPLLLFVVPALAGYPRINGDNALQNFPLRVFSGDQLRAGHLPLWNPYIWSG